MIQHKCVDRMFSAFVGGLVVCVSTAAWAQDSVSFIARRDYPAPHPWAIAVGDFNGDGPLDLAMAGGYGVGVVSVRLGLCDGSFGDERRFPVGSYPLSLAIGDFNGDGVLDLAVASQSTNSVSVLLGLGDGSFAPEHRFAVGSGPQSIAVADFDGDGVLDLVVANSYLSNSVSVVLGLGDGSFAAEHRFAVGGYAHAVAAGDFNGDGIPDLVVSNSGGLSVLLGIGDPAPFGLIRFVREFRGTDRQCGGLLRSIPVSMGKLRDLRVIEQPPRLARTSGE